jgi:type II secretory pathway component HofQ
MRTIVAIAALAFIACLGTGTPAAEKDSTSPPQKPAVVNERPLQQVLEYLSTVSGMTIKVKSDDLKKLPVKVDFITEQMSWRPILETLCRNHKLRLDESGLKEKQLVVYRPACITLQVKDADVREVIWSIAREGKLNIVIDSEVQGNVTASLKNVPCDEALETIVKTLGYVTVREKGSLLRVK